jgi:hypothetical protein
MRGQIARPPAIEPAADGWDGRDPSLTADKAGQLAMTQIVLIGLGAGAAAALLFASVSSGTSIAVVLFYFLPLPILIAALGFSHWAGLIGVLTAAIGLSAYSGMFLPIAFLLGVGLPAWWLGYLALLARPGTAETLEWYPVGRLVLWAVGIGTVLAASVIPFFGTDEETFRKALKASLEQALRAQTRTPADSPLQIPGMSNPDRFLDIITRTLLPAIAVSSTLIYTVNLWLAGRIVKISDRLARPWPDIPSMRFPLLAPGLLAAAIVGTLMPGMLGMVSVILVASLLTAFAFLGLAVVHVLTRGLNARTFILASLYVAIVLFSFPISWPLLAMSLLGLIDTALDLRGRLARTRGPPAPRT